MVFLKNPTLGCPKSGLANLIRSMDYRPDNVDQAFCRFQQSGNPDDIGEVFDATTPRLLHSAQHLASDAHGAEDLLQATLLIAIQSRGKYQPSGSVASWLFAILSNEARSRRHSWQRRRAQ